MLLSLFSLVPVWAGEVYQRVDLRGGGGHWGRQDGFASLGRRADGQLQIVSALTLPLLL